MRIVCISDTHLRHGVAIPGGDVLVHAGDLTMTGELAAIAKALSWIARPLHSHKHKLVIAGNHDWLFQKEPSLARSIVPEGVTYLQDSGVMIDGLRFWGSPWQPWFMDWAFNLEEYEELAERWRQIPLDTSVLITHGPPYGILDQLPDGRHVGDRALSDRLPSLKNLKLHVFGHIHCGYGMQVTHGVTFVNACICDEQYRQSNSPIVVDIPER
jgi:Icc-related predicted phosphoesterase